MKKTKKGSLRATRDARSKAATAAAAGGARAEMAGHDPVQRIEEAEATYRTGTAARLAGIPVETLRVWERRYGVVRPRQTSRGHRLYTAEDVARLALIKRLRGAGVRVRSIAALSLSSLKEAASAARAAPHIVSSRQTERALRVALVGESLSALEATGGLPSNVEFVAVGADAPQVLEALRGQTVDLLAIELPTLQAEAVATIEELVRATGAQRALVAYRFGPAQTLSALRERGHQLIHGVLDRDAIEGYRRQLAAVPASPPEAVTVFPTLPVIPRQRFDDETLARLAQSSVTMYCECPKHVTELLRSIGAFERYSAECRNRSPADAALHEYLQRVAGSARYLFEDAVVRLAQAEGLTLPPETGGPDRGA